MLKGFLNYFFSYFIYYYYVHSFVKDLVKYLILSPLKRSWMTCLRKSSGYSRVFPKYSVQIFCRLFFGVNNYFLLRYKYEMFRFNELYRDILWNICCRSVYRPKCLYVNYSLYNKGTTRNINRNISIHFLVRGGRRARIFFLLNWFLLWFCSPSDRAMFGWCFREDRSNWRGAALSF